jgi:hypothetical protein
MLRSSLFWDVTQRRLVVSYNLSVPSSRVKQSKVIRLISCPEALVTTNASCVRSQKSEDLTDTTAEE